MNLEILRKTFSGDIDTTAETLQLYSHDASLFEVVPKVVVFPKHSADVQALMKWANQQGDVSITARSAGTCMSGGAINDSVIVVFTKYMNILGEVNVEEKTLVTQPGVFYRDFEKATMAKGLMYPAFPASKEICAMGGIVGNNGAGEKTLRYGKAEDYVISTKIVFTDGNEYAVVPLTKPELDAKDGAGGFRRRTLQESF